MNYRLSPSDLTFLYDGCKHCFVLKVKYGISQPSIPLPSIFSMIASIQKSYYSGRRTEEFCPSLPPGIVKFGEKKVCSKKIQIPDSDSTCYISGRFDIVAELDNGGFAIIDFKTGNPKDEKSAMYSRQLNAYAMALENPEPGALELRPVIHLGLIYFIPGNCELVQEAQQILKGPIQMIPIARDDGQFLDFLAGVVKLLDGPTPKMDPDKCAWCKRHAQILGLSEVQPSAAAILPDELSVPRCPKCGGLMRLVSGKFGEFWSCQSYPNCRGTRNIKEIEA
jgi:hypothetical protein